MSRAVQRVEAAEILPPLFDYSVVESAVADRLRARVERVRGYGRQTVEITGKIGRELLAAQGELEHGQFLTWVDREVGISKSAAYRAMDVAENLGPELPKLGSLPLTIVHQIAAKSTPEPIRAEIVSRIGAGERIAPEEIKERVRTAKDKARKDREAADLKAKLDKMSPEERKANDTKAKRQRRAREKQDAEIVAWRRQGMEEELAKLDAAREATDLLLPLIGSHGDRLLPLLVAAKDEFAGMLRERLGEPVHRGNLSRNWKRARLRRYLAEGMPEIPRWATAWDPELADDDPGF